MIYKCVNCEKQFNKEQLLLSKTKETSHIIHLQYRCPTCNKTEFKLLAELHKRITNNGVKFNEENKNE